MSQCSSHRLDTSTAHIVERVLLCQRPAGSLGVRTQSQRLRILRVELLHNLCPQHTCGTHFGNFHKVVRSDGPEERETRCESIDVNTRSRSGTQIFQTVCQGVSQLDVCRSTRFLHVVAGDGDRVELRHFLGSIFKDVRDNLHRECRRVDIGITHHEFLQDIVLDSTSHFFQLGTLLQTCVDVECHNRKYGTVHSHRDGHLVQRNSIEQHLHILQGTDRYTCLTNVTHYTFVVGVVATVSGQVESYGQTFLSGSQITTVKGI